MNNIIEKIQNLGIVPVVKIDNADYAAPLAKALCEGGLPCVEVTFRTEAAKQSISNMITEYPNMLVGAGTILTTQQVDEAIEAGAQFIVSPGLNPKVVKYCKERGILIIPGCSNPSDVEQAIELGLEVVKFFPAEAAGGLNMIKSMAAPYSNIKFMPTGGINIDNLNKYLNFDKIIACGGSWMVSSELLDTNNFDEIRKLTNNSVKEMLGFSIVHIGVNTDSKDEAIKNAKIFEKLFGFRYKEEENSVFAGLGIELMKKQFLGDKGHIAIGTNHINRAISYLKSNGCDFDETNMFYNKKGKLISIYLKEQILGFAIHLLQN